MRKGDKVYYLDNTEEVYTVAKKRGKYVYLEGHGSRYAVSSFKKTSEVLKNTFTGEPIKLEF
jgi:hypothetical protein